jgi:hypothetical protein
MKTMIFSYFLIFLLCVENCYTNDLNHTKTNEICESEKLLVRFSRQNVVSQVESNSKVEAPKSESAQEASKSQKPSEKKMEPRTNSHKNSHSAPSRRAKIAATLKQKLKPLVRIRPISKLYSKVKQLAKKFSLKARSFSKDKFSGWRKKVSNSKQLSKKLSTKLKNSFKQFQKRFPGLKSKYFSKAKHSNQKSKLKLAMKGKNFFKKTNKRLSGLRSKYFSNKKQLAKRNSISKLKKNLIFKAKHSSKNTKKTNKRPNIKQCGIKRTKRGLKLKEPNVCGGSPLGGSGDGFETVNRKKGI